MSRLERIVVAAWCVWMVSGLLWLVYQVGTVRHGWWLP